MTKNPKPLKLIIILVTALAAGIGLWVYFGTAEKLEDPTLRYKISVALDAAAIEGMVNVMRQEPEFMFYFKVLDEGAQRQLVQEAAAIILQSASSADLLARIREAYEATQSLGAAFYFMEYNEDFIRRPQEYPQLEGLFWSFIKEEFKLAILGVYYKAHYDAQFSFSWDELTRSAAAKLRQLHDEMLKYGPKK